jgi:hypothetical protein
MWHPELIEWCRWRVESAGPEAALRGEALFWQPTARNPLKRWTPDPAEHCWSEACKAAKVPPVPLQRGTRHSTITALSPYIGKRMLQALTRHRDGRSLDHYDLSTVDGEQLRKVFEIRRED